MYRPQPDRTILDHVTFAFPPGKVTALVGRSGSGKTTILRLVSRLFDPQEGRITIGGVDIRELKLSELRSMIATVSQFPLFVEADVRENLRLGVPNASDAAMEAACRAADLWPALERIAPADPLATPVPRMAGKSGLAGGERRRLAIARALLAEPRILLLDEPSTGIDAVSIKKIVEAIRTATIGRTVLLVDHDMELVAGLADLSLLPRGRPLHRCRLAGRADEAAEPFCASWRTPSAPMPIPRSSRCTAPCRCAPAEIAAAPGAAVAEGGERPAQCARSKPAQAAAPA